MYKILKILHRTQCSKTARCSLPAKPNKDGMGTSQRICQIKQSEVPLTELERLVYEGFSHVIPEVWKKLVSHVEQKIEDDYWECDGFYHTTRNEFITHVGKSSDNSSSSLGDSSLEDYCSEED